MASNEQYNGVHHLPPNVNMWERTGVVAKELPDGTTLDGIKQSYYTRGAVRPIPHTIVYDITGTSTEVRVVQAHLGLSESAILSVNRSGAYIQRGFGKETPVPQDIEAALAILQSLAK